MDVLKKNENKTIWLTPMQNQVVIGGGAQWPPLLGPMRLISPSCFSFFIALFTFFRLSRFLVASGIFIKFTIPIAFIKILIYIIGVLKL